MQSAFGGEEHSQRDRTVKRASDPTVLLLEPGEELPLVDVLLDLLAVLLLAVSAAEVEIAAEGKQLLPQ